MPNQYSKLTADNIHTKINRRRNPVRNATQLAEEFGYTTTYHRYTDGTTGRRAPSTFVEKVKALVGEATYNSIRDSRFINNAYR